MRSGCPGARAWTPLRLVVSRHWDQKTPALEPARLGNASTHEVFYLVRWFEMIKRLLIKCTSALWEGRKNATYGFYHLSLPLGPQSRPTYLDNSQSSLRTSSVGESKLTFEPIFITTAFAGTGATVGSEPGSQAFSICPGSHCSPGP